MNKESEKILKGIIDTVTFEVNDNELSEKIVKQLQQIFRIENEPKKVCGKFNIWNYVSNDKVRPQMCCIHHDGGYRVACDTHILVAIKSGYPEEYEGKNLSKNGEFCGYIYPKWRSVIPQIGTNEYGRQTTYDGGYAYTEYPIDFAKFDKLYLEYKAEQKVPKEHTTEYIVKIGNAMFKISFLKKVIDFMREYGIGTIWTCSPNRPLYCFDGIGNECILMPKTHLEEGDVEVEL